HLPGAPEEKLRLDFDWLAIYFHHGIGEEIDGAGSRLRLDDQVAALAELNSVRGVMAKVIIGQAGILVGFADIHRHPLAVREELRPTVVAIDAAVVSLRRDGGADGETSRDAGRARQRDEVGVKIRAIA